MTTFRFNPKPETTATVRVNVPVEEGVAEQTFKARFLVLPQSEREAMADDPKAALRRIWLGWEGIEDCDGRSIPFSDEMRDELLEYDYVYWALAQAYQRATAGIEAKN